MTHYICTGGCKGVSEEQKNCGAQVCEKKDQPLTPCDCADMRHHGAFEEHEEEIAQGKE